MKRRVWLLVALLTFLWATPAAAENRFVVRSTLGSLGLSSFCLLQSCTVVGALDGNLNQLFLLTTPDIINPTTFLTLLQSTPGIVDAELDQAISLVGGLNQVTTPPAGLSDSTPVNYSGTMVWNGYANQPAAQIVHVAQAQSTFHVTGTGIVADIDTGVDPNHPALQPVLLPGYDFTRNQPGASELNDLSDPSGMGCSTCQPAQVNQHTAAMVDQHTAAMVDGQQDSAFGHGTMVMGIIHLVAPQAQLLPLKAFKADGTGFLSDILRAVYYAVQNKANVINMSFDTKTSSTELPKALAYASQNNVICAASAGNDGMQETVYPAALQNDVMGVASTDDLDQRSSFSNFGNAIVWVAAPGEAIITTYPFSTYAAGWGTSFSAPFVSGTGALLLNQQPNTNESQAAAAVAHAVPLGAGMGNGRLDLMPALQSQPAGTGTGVGFAVSANPSSTTINAGQSATYTLSVKPNGGFNQTVTWSCSGAPAGSACTVSPSSVKLDGTNAATATVTVTTARSVLPPRTHPRFVPPTRPWGLARSCLAWLLVMGLLWNLSRARRRNGYISPAVLLLVVAFCTSCGGGSPQSTSNPPSSPGGGAPAAPQAATSAITLTGTSDNVSHATSVKLIVN
ncbi:MAG: S8 family serine peptidase [Candidatus Acidiferrales bacterium]